MVWGIGRVDAADGGMDNLSEDGTKYKFSGQKFPFVHMYLLVSGMLHPSFSAFEVT